MLLGLDLSTSNTGFAFGDENSLSPKCGAWRLPGADEMVINQTLNRLFDSIAALAKSIKPTTVVIEAFIAPTAGSNFHTIQALIQCAGVARLAATRAGAEVILISSQSVRKVFLGQGRPDNPKQAVIARCKALGWNVDNHDAADACACWAYGMAKKYPDWASRLTPLFAEGARA
jgi:Holliday junction resolvasome RuvABC endonuclease subunit